MGQNLASRTDEDYSNNDCGPACIAMWLNSLGRSVTIDDVSKATGLLPGYKYTIYTHLVKAAANWQLGLMRKAPLDLAALHQQIDAGYPIIILVHYESMPRRFSMTFRAGHWILVVGYTDTEIVYHDPLAPDESGAYVTCGNAEFLNAMRDCTIDGNQPYQGIVRAVA